MLLWEESIMALALDLQEFILRARVLKLYRQALRTAQRAPVHASGEVSYFVKPCI